jgi:hypothetical protein
MRNEIAEWVLSRVAEPEHAKTILGDLLEAQLGPVAFWLEVVRATLSIASHQPRPVLVRFFWFAGELCFYVCMAWTFARTKHVILLLAIWLVVMKMLEKILEWGGLVGPKNTHLLLPAAFSFWAGKYLIGGSTAYAVLFVLATMSPDVWTRWCRWRKNRAPENHRPVVG